ncbi:MAG: DUF4215 domain-containing protein [Sandaracinaceae bacterium]|nr:DUF4215 domain-containing protein [Sandaracinaceae bacterium]
MFGFCDAAATPAPECSTAAVDPCMGMTLCTPEGRACDSSTLRVCARNAFGCLVETATDCTATSEVCGDRGGMAVCDDVCSFRTTCSSASYCDGSDAVQCANDADGCLVESSRSTCGGGTTCQVASGTASCVDALCPVAEPTVLDCASGTVSGNTMGGSTVRNGYTGCSTLPYPGAERIYRFRNSGTARVAVRIVSTRGASTADFDLFVWDGGDGTSVSCTEATLTCLDSSVGTTATETVDFIAAPGTTQFVAYDLYSVATGTTDFTLAVTCTPMVCGDGILVTGEGCDDGNTNDMDGCSSACAVEAGYGCTGTPSVCTPLCGNGTLNTGEGCDDGNTNNMDGCSSACTVESGYACAGSPSVCLTFAANSTCAGATAVTSTTTITGENIVRGGPRPQGTSCGTSTGNSALYYAVTIPGNTRVDVVTSNTTLDRVLLTQDACGDPACTFRSDTAPESAAFVNTGTTPITRIVAIHNWSSSGTGTYDIAFTYSMLAPNSTCAGAIDPPASADLRIGAGARPTGTACTTGTTGALYYTIDIPALSTATVTVTPTGSPSWNPAILAVADCSATGCLASRDTAGTGAAEILTLTNTTGSPITNVVAVTAASTTTFGAFDIAVTTAALELNAVCSGAIAPPDNADLRVGAGPRPAGTGCSTSGGPALYYTIDIPASSRAIVTATPTGAWNPSLIVIPDCAGTQCLGSSDTAGTSAPESIVLDNRTGSTIQRIVAVSSASTTTLGVFDIAATAGPLPYTPIPASCADMSGGTVVAGVATDDSTSVISALPFSFNFFGSVATHYSVTSNGFAQLWTSSTGTPNNTFVNAAIPASGVPNGYVAPFWDDLRPNTGAVARTLVTGAPGDQRFVIEWSDWRATFGGTENLRFQAHLVEASGAIEYHYCVMTPGADLAYSGSGATIGAESIDGTTGLLISFNVGGTVTTGSGFRFAP